MTMIAHHQREDRCGHGPSIARCGAELRDPLETISSLGPLGCPWNQRRAPKWGGRRVTEGDRGVNAILRPGGAGRGVWGE